MVSSQLQRQKAMGLIRDGSPTVPETLMRYGREYDEALDRVRTHTLLHTSILILCVGDVEGHVDAARKNLNL